jgi:hypothetical protein
MIDQTYIEQVLEYLKDKPCNKLITFDEKHSKYNATVLALKEIIDRGIDRQNGFELLFITPLPQSFFNTSKLPGVDYQPTGFIKHEILNLTAGDSDHIV